MAAPTYQSTTVTDFGSDATTHAAAMPATVNAGDLLLAFVGFDGASTTVTTPGNWTKLIGMIASDPVGGIYALKASGSEGGTTVDWATSNSQRGSIHIIRVTGWTGNLFDLLVAISHGGSSGGCGVSLFVGATHDILWIYGGFKSSTTPWGSTPSGYSNETKSAAGEETISSCAIVTGTKSDTAVRSEVAPPGWVANNSLVNGQFMVAVPADAL